MTDINMPISFTASELASISSFEVSEVSLIYRSKVPQSKRPQIRNSPDSYTIFLANWDLDSIELIETFKVLYLNRNNRVLGLFKVSNGGLSGTVADPRLIMVMALKLCATALILCHNHPSGSLRPSNADELLTSKIKHAAAYLDIKVADHLIICNEGYFSFADEGIL